MEPDLSDHQLIRVIKASQDYHDAVEYIGTKKFGGPKNVDEMKRLLKMFMGKPAGEYFSEDRMEAFAQVQLSITASSRNKKNWNRSTMPADLAMIFLLSEAEDRREVPVCLCYENCKKKHPLEKAVEDLRQVCVLARSAYIRLKQAEENRKAKIPKSLDHQKSGQRIQDSIRFNSRKADADPCPNCGHYNTMAVESQKSVNAENEKRRKKAGNGKFDGVSCKKACLEIDDS